MTFGKMRPLYLVLLLGLIVAVLSGFVTALKSTEDFLQKQQLAVICLPLKIALPRGPTSMLRRMTAPQR